MHKRKVQLQLWLKYDENGSNLFNWGVLIMQANLNKVWVVGLFITFGHFSWIFFFSAFLKEWPQMSKSLYHRPFLRTRRRWRGHWNLKLQKDNRLVSININHRFHIFWITVFFIYWKFVYFFCTPEPKVEWKEQCFSNCYLRQYSFSEII